MLPEIDLTNDDFILIISALQKRSDQLKFNADYPGKEQDLLEYDQLIAKVVQLRKIGGVEPLKEADLILDLQSVGPEKPLGCLPLSQIQEMGLKLVDLMKEATEKDLTAIIFSGEQCFTIGGALYIYDHIVLQDLLSENVGLLEEAGWPTEADEFVKHTAMNDAPVKTKLFNLVADAFADKTNPNRL